MSEYFEKLRALDEWDGVSPFTPIDWDGSFECVVCGGEVPGPIDMWQDCPTCGWEDDPLQRAEPDFNGGPNAGVSVNMARSNFARCGFAIPSRHQEEIQALIDAGKLLPDIDYMCEVCGTKMPGYFISSEVCPTCSWRSNYAGKYINPKCVTEMGTLEEAWRNYKKAGKIMLDTGNVW